MHECIYVYIYVVKYSKVYANNSAKKNIRHIWCICIRDRCIYRIHILYTPETPVQHIE